MSMLSIASERGLDCDALLREVGIDKEAVENGSPVPVELYGSLYQSIANQLSQEWFGMLSGDAVPRGAIRYLCLLAVHCQTLEAAVLRCHGFFELCRGFKIKQTLERGEEYSLFRISKLSTVTTQEFDTLIRNTSPDIIKATIAVLHGFAEWIIGSEIPIRALYYPFPPPAGQHPYPRPYPIHYDAEFCGYLIDSAYLDYPVLQTEEGIDNFSNQAPYFVFVKDHLNVDSTTKRVKNVLMKNQGETTLTADKMADLLNLSTTSFHRKLNQEGTRFQQIKDEYRLELTLYHLGQPGVKTTDIAARLGFDSPSEFYRSFKKWTGMTLREYRSSL